MDSSNVIVALLSVAAAIGVSLITNLISRPKVRAEAGATEAGGQVAVSADAREWVREFRDAAAKAETRAQLAEQRAQAAEERADGAEERASHVEARMDVLDHRFDLAIGYIRVLQREVAQAAGHTPPGPPPELIPPLSPI